MLRFLATILSLVVPGGGQLSQGRLRDGLLFFWAAFWFHAMTLGALIAAYPRLEGRALTFCVGAFGVPRGFAVPTAVIFTGVAIALHVWSARDAYLGRGRSHAPTSTAVG